MCTINEDHMKGHFLIFDTPNNPKNEKKPHLDIILHSLVYHKWWPPKQPGKSKWKNAWRYYHFTYVYHKWKLHDVWFLRHGVQQTYFFSNFGPFFVLLTPLKNKSSKFWKTEKKKKNLSLLYTSVPKIMTICYVLEIWWVTNVIVIFHFGLFFPLLPF